MMQSLEVSLNTKLTMSKNDASVYPEMLAKAEVMPISNILRSNMQVELPILPNHAVGTTRENNNELKKCQGQKWQAVFDFEKMLKQICLTEKQLSRSKSENSNKNNNDKNSVSLSNSTRGSDQVKRLDGNDMHYYGIVPKHTPLEVVVCNVCRGIYTRMGFNNHMILQHPTIWSTISTKLTATPQNDTYSLHTNNKSPENVRDINTTEIFGSPSDISDTVSTCSNESSFSSISSTYSSSRRRKSNKNESPARSSSGSSSGRRSRGKSKHCSSSQSKHTSSTSSASADVSQTKRKSSKKSSSAKYTNSPPPFASAASASVENSKIINNTSSIGINTTLDPVSAITVYSSSSNSSCSLPPTPKMISTNMPEVCATEPAPQEDVFEPGNLNPLNELKETLSTDVTAMTPISSLKEKTNSSSIIGQESVDSSNSNSSSEYEQASSSGTASSFKSSNATAFPSEEKINEIATTDAEVFDEKEELNEFDPHISELDQAVSSITCDQDSKIDISNEEDMDEIESNLAAIAGVTEFKIKTTVEERNEDKNVVRLPENEHPHDSTYAPDDAPQPCEEALPHNSSDDSSILTLEDMLNDSKFINEILNTTETEINFDESELDTTVQSQQDDCSEQPPNKRIRIDESGTSQQQSVELSEEYAVFKELSEQHQQEPPHQDKLESHQLEVSQPHVPQVLEMNQQKVTQSHLEEELQPQHQQMLELQHQFPEQQQQQILEPQRYMQHLHFPLQQQQQLLQPQLPQQQERLNPQQQLQQPQSQEESLRPQQPELVESQQHLLHQQQHQLLQPEQQLLQIQQQQQLIQEQQQKLLHQQLQQSHENSQALLHSQQEKAVQPIQTQLLHPVQAQLLQPLQQQLAVQQQLPAQQQLSLPVHHELPAQQQFTAEQKQHQEVIHPHQQQFLQSQLQNQQILQSQQQLLQTHHMQQELEEQLQQPLIQQKPQKHQCLQPEEKQKHLMHQQHQILHQQQQMSQPPQLLLPEHQQMLQPEEQMPQQELLSQKQEVLQPEPQIKSHDKTNVDDIKLFNTEQQPQGNPQYHIQEDEQQQQITAIDGIQLQQLLYQQQNLNAYGNGDNIKATAAVSVSQQPDQQIGHTSLINSKSAVGGCAEEELQNLKNVCRNTVGRKVMEYNSISYILNECEKIRCDAVPAHFRVLNVPSLTDDGTDDIVVPTIVDNVRTIQHYMLPPNEESFMCEITANNHVAMMSHLRQQQVIADYLKHATCDDIDNLKNAVDNNTNSRHIQVWDDPSELLDFDFSQIETAKSLTNTTSSSSSSNSELKGVKNDHSTLTKYNEDFFSVYTYTGVPRPLSVNPFGCVKFPQATATTFRKNLLTTRKANNSPITLSGCINGVVGSNAVTSTRFANANSKPAQNLFTSLSGSNTSSSNEFSIGSITIQNSPTVSQHQASMQQKQQSSGGPIEISLNALTNGVAISPTSALPRARPKTGATLSSLSSGNSCSGMAKTKSNLMGAPTPVAVVTPTTRIATRPNTLSQNAKTIYVNNTANPTDRVKFVKRALIAKGDPVKKSNFSAKITEMLNVNGKNMKIQKQQKQQQQSDEKDRDRDMDVEDEEFKIKPVTRFYERRRKLFNFANTTCQRQQDKLKHKLLKQQIFRTLSDCGINSIAHKNKSNSNTSDIMRVFV